MSYDPDHDLLYYGTGNPAPYNPEQRAGDNKWTASVLARRPEDGALVWAYRSEEHTSELQSQSNLVCRLLLEKKTKLRNYYATLTPLQQPDTQPVSSLP